MLRRVGALRSTYVGEALNSVIIRPIISLNIYQVFKFFFRYKESGRQSAALIL